MNNQFLNNKSQNSMYSFTMLKNIYFVKHNHFYMEILLNIGGKAKISIDDKTFEMSKNDIIYIKPNEFYQIEESSYYIVSLKINQNGLQGFNPKQATNFSCNSTLEANKQLFSKLRSTFVAFLKSELVNNDDKTLQSYSYIYTLINELNTKFISTSNLSQSDNKHYERIQQIITYIDKNYDQALSLTDLADEFHLSVPYLSSFFQKYIKSNFKDYYDLVRLRHAKELILSTNLSLEEISYKVGFQSLQTFFRVFKSKEGITPTNYKHSVENSKNEIIDDDEVYTLLSNYANSLAEYNITEVTKVPNISFQNVIAKNKKPYQKILGLGDAKDILYQTVQSIAIEATKNIQYEYGFIRGIFSDSMHVLTKKNNQYVYGFSFVDEVLDFILSLNVKPIIQLSYMPSPIAKISPKPYSYINNFSPYEPISIESWTDLVKELFSHLVSYYGAQEVSNWIFTPWRQPDSSPALFGFKNKDDFFIFYKETYSVIKSIIPDAKIGSPEFLPLSEYNLNFIDDFYSWVIKNNCCPQIILFSCYMNVVEYDENNFEKSNLGYSKDKDLFKRVISKMNYIANKHHISYQSKFILTYNLTYTHQDFLLDTAFMGPFVCKNVLENMNEIDGFGYWKLSDIEDMTSNRMNFPGKIGLYYKNNIQKPQNSAHIFMSNLFPNIIAQGEGYIVTKNASGTNLVILLYNYEHYSDKYADRKMTDIIDKNRYMVFNNQVDMDILLEINDILGYSSAEISKFFVNRKYGSPYDSWVDMGYPNLETKDKSRYKLLQGLSNPFFKTYSAKIIDGVLRIHEHLSPFEIKTLSISLKH